MLWMAMVGAVEVAGRVVPCPVGGGSVRVYDKLSENKTGGYDSDFATYSSNGQWRQYAVVSCENSLFSMLGSDMGRGIEEEKREIALEAAKGAEKLVKNPSGVMIWERYGIAVAVYQSLGKDHQYLGNLWLTASWTVRDAAVGYYAGLSGPVMARELLTAGWEELKKPLSTKDRKNVLYNLARVAHRGGWGAERDAYLTSFESLGLDERERTAVARFRELAHTIEPALQQNALVEYALALQGSLAPYEQDRLKYTMADLYRRTNQPEKAREFFKAVLNSEASDELRGLAQFLLAD